MAIRIGHLADSSDIARKVGAVRRVLVASPEYLARHEMPQTPQDLHRHRLISFTALSAADHWRFVVGGVSEGISVTPSYVTNSADAAIWHATQGGGLTMALSYQVADHLRDGRLALVMPEYEPAPYPVQFIYPNSRLLSVKVRAFIAQASETRNWDFLTLAGQ